MNAVPVWIPLLSALIGAIAAGLFQTIMKEVERHREREATLSALAMEVRSICQMIRFREYETYTQAVLDELLADPARVATVVIDLRENYFSVYEALSPKLGLLAPNHGVQIVEFYILCKSVKDSCYPDGVMAENENRELAIANLEQLVSLLKSILKAGDSIAQFPKASLADLAAK